MTQDYSNPLVYWSVMGQMMTHFELMLTNAADDSMMVVEKLKRMNITPDAITTTVQFHWASALVFEEFNPVPLIGLSPPGNSMHASKYYLKTSLVLFHSRKVKVPARRVQVFS